MRSNISNGSRASFALGFISLFALMLAMGVGLATFPAEAAPFAYVANHYDELVDGTVSVIDTAATPRPSWPRSGWGRSPLGSPSPRTGNRSMSRILIPTPSR